MTDDELDRMELLWLRRVPIKDIADKLGYSRATIAVVARNDRKRFPYRRNRVDDGRLAIWLERIRAKRATLDDAASALGIHRETVRRRLHEWEARMAEGTGADEA